MPLKPSKSEGVEGQPGTPKPADEAKAVKAVRKSKGAAKADDEVTTVSTPSKEAIAVAVAEHETIVEVELAEAVEIEAVDTQALKKDLKLIFKQLNIQKIMYVDDEFNEVVNWEKAIEDLLALDRELLNQSFAEIKAITEAPDESFLKSAIADHLEDIKASQESIDVMVVLLKKLNIQPESAIHSPVMETLELLFDKAILFPLSPNQWKSKSLELRKMVKAGPVLMLCDQDLKQQETGVDIIEFLKKSEFADCFYCALISDLIVSTQRELAWRKEQQDAGKLPAVNFFALSKERTKEPMLICDGIKKTLLNDYLDKIKIATKEILQDAFEKTLKEVESIDTYDFDHSILRASVNEGTWEIETLLRIVDSIFNKQIKQSMIDKEFLKNANPIIKKAVDISKVRFKVSKEKTFEPPYDKRYRLRHEELYESSNLINKLHTPINNGDIFMIHTKEMKDGAEVSIAKPFILVDQECDIVIRANGKRNRKTGFSTILPITIKSNQQIEIDRDAFNQEHGLTNYYFHNRYKLDYLEFVTNEDYKHGIVDFANPYFITFDVLDLISFNAEGKTIYKIRNNSDLLCDPNVLTIALESRMKKIDVIYKQKLERFKSIYQSLGDLTGKETLFDQIKGLFTISPCVNFPELIANQVIVTSAVNDLEFGIQRTSRLNVVKAKNLLNRYNDYLSRFADDHDFARDIKGR